MLLDKGRQIQNGTCKINVQENLLTVTVL